MIPAISHAGRVCALTLLSSRQRLRCSKKPAGGRLSRRALVNLTLLEFEIQVGGEEIVFIRWIGRDGQTTYISASAEIVIVPPTVGVVQGEADSASQVVCRCDTDAVHIQLGIEPIIIDQVWIERELLGVLIPNVDLPIVFRF